ncbi:L-type lectin-domain containing receptor kinase SIT2-like [Oryza brachyantha]|uniref:L-type lectin-domain containing receptor kinase SIT2-like n=1 Tax=Oryza brachyantha TaxID=4533 RepID=UPI001ADD0109|nr:L-type lectin-domain containing receptor kinase SIT2-like [Oryza brachyantha]
MHLKPNSIVSFLVLLQLFHVLVRSHEAAAAATGGGGDSEQFMYEGFAGARLDLDGMALVEPDGKLMLSNVTSQLKGHAFHPAPLRFHALSARAPRNGTASAARSFSTTFVFAIAAEYVTVSGNGLAFFVAPSKNMSAALPSQFLGLFNSGNIGNASNHIFAVELDTIINPEFHDINSNHVGVDVNGLVSVDSKPAGYYADDTGEFKNLTLFSGAAMQVWVDYDGGAMVINVTLAPVEVPKPRKPLLSVPVDLSSVVTDEAYVGFSSSTGPHKTRHYVLGWSFALDGPAPPLDYTKLPKLPRANAKRRSMLLKVVVPVATSLIVLAVVIGASLHIWHRRRRHAEVREDWEVEFGPHRFAYKDLVRATRGFDGKRLLGVGGFGRVYRGVLPVSRTEVAVKVVSHDAKQGMRQFIAEVVSIGRLRHRNVVPLLGYCRRRGELLLVYDYMPNGSLDRWLYGQGAPPLSWAQRLRAIRGVAAGLLYLHEDWEQVVVHRDVKASNVLLDGEMNARLGDFGLARLYDRGADPKTTRVVGTMGYLAPELAHTRRATPATDVFAFGSFVLEVVCGRRPIEHGGTGDGGDDGQLVLADWVLDRWHKGDIAGAADARLCGDYDREKAALVLKLGLLCSQPAPGARPSMRQVVQFLDGDAALPPELAPTYRSFTTLAITPSADGFDSSAVSCPSSTVTSVDGGGSSVHSGDRAQETETRSLIETL